MNILFHLLRYLTTIYEIKNVWANDAHKTAIFISLVYFPFLAYTVFKLNKNSILNRVINQDLVKYSFSYSFFNIELVFILIVFSYICGAVGIGQIILEPVYDAIARSIGVIIFINGILLYLILYGRQQKVLDAKKTIYMEINMYKFIRNPEYTFLLMIAIGCSLITVSFPGIVLSIIVLFPFMLVRICIVEKDIIKNDPEYSNNMLDVPRLLPNIFYIIKRIIFKEI